MNFLPFVIVGSLVIIIPQSSTAFVLPTSNQQRHAGPYFPLDPDTNRRLSPLFFQQGGGTYSFVARRSSNYNSGGITWDNSNFLDALSQGGAASKALQQVNQEYQQQAQFNAQKRRSVLAASFDNYDEDDEGYPVQGQDNEDLDAAGQVQVPPHLIKKPAPVNEENPSGAQMFRRMMEKAKAGNLGARSMTPAQTNAVAPATQSPPMSAPNAYNINPQMQPNTAMMSNIPNMQQQPSQPPFYMDPQQAYYQAQLQAWQQQMMAFAQLSALNPQAAASMTMPPPPPPPPPSNIMMPVYPTVTQATTATMPTNTSPEPHPYAPSQPQNQEGNKKKEKDLKEFLPKAPPGRSNRDAYDIVNAADVYFAQLKRDSTVRSLARQAGDDETANKPFADEGVIALKDFFSDALTDARKEVRDKSNDLFTTSREEMLILPTKEDFVDARTKEQQMKDSGVKFKQMLEQKRKRKAEESTVVPTTNPTASTQALKEPVVIPNRIETTSSLKTKESNTKDQPIAASTPSQLPTPITTSKVSSVAESAPVATASIPVSSTTIATSTVIAPSLDNNTPQDTEENRKMIRTLMGLLLKHRGGTGFGAGRLKSPEDARLEDTFSKVLALLTSETDLQQNSSPSIVSPVVSNPPSINALSANGPSSSKSLIGGALECVKAVVTMYESASSSQQADLLVPVRDAMMSAVNTLNRVLKENEESMVIETKNLPFPEKYEFAEEISDVPDSKIVSSSTEEDNEEDIDSTARLQEIFKNLQSYQGEEKFGLRKVSNDDISSISDLLSDMRGILMNELGA